MPASLKILLAVLSVTVSITLNAQNNLQKADSTRTASKKIRDIGQPGTRLDYQSGQPVKKEREISREDGKIVVTPEIQPAFPGGQEGLDQFILKNVRYPVEAINAGAEGIVVVRFTIGPDGRAHTPVIITDKVGHDAAEEVKRLIQLMPRWTPAYIDDMAVPVDYTYPVNFNLQKMVK